MEDLKLFSATFLTGDNTFRQAIGVKLSEEESVQDFIIKRAVPKMRQAPQNDLELMGEYKLCVASEIDINEALKELSDQGIVIVKPTEIVKEVIKEIKINELDDPKTMLKYMRDKYAKKDERLVFNRIIRRIKKDAIIQVS